jgi:hypothetical protein
MCCPGMKARGTGIDRRGTVGTVRQMEGGKGTGKRPADHAENCRMATESRHETIQQDSMYASVASGPFSYKTLR